MSVEVYFWGPSRDGVGHASIYVDGGSPPDPMYMSAWPVRGDYSDIVFGPVLFKSYAQDVKEENGVPSVTRFTKLDETAIKAAIRKVKGFGHYGLFSGNCAGMTAYCLAQGTSAPPPLVNTPWGLWLYARSLTMFYD